MATTMMAPPRDWREARRLRAWELKQQGWQQRMIAAALGVTPGAVSQWLKRAAAGGGEPPRDPARRGGHRGLVHRALAGPKKGADEQGRVILWLDESGFYLLPAAVRTYAPRGQTPVLRVPLSRDHLSVISSISRDGELV